MKPKSRLATFTIFLSIFCWLSLATAAQPLTSRAATASSYLERGNTWYAKGEFERALADYSLAIAADPSLAAAYFNRGAVRQRKGDAEGALSDYNRALELNPRDAQAYFNRGLLYHERGV
jgi:tetratricopeptide (TPR) repeat protein